MNLDETTPHVNVDATLLRILVCPLDKGPLIPVGDPAQPSLYNPRLRRRYPVVDGIPQLLPSSGIPVSEAEHERFAAGGA